MISADCSTEEKIKLSGSDAAVRQKGNEKCAWVDI